MENNIVPAASRELQTANADQVSSMTNEVLELDRGLQENNTELSLLNEALDGLDRTLRRNKSLKSSVRSSMQKIITKL